MIQRRRKVIVAPQPETWSPPDFNGHLHTRIGASIVEQFVAGHYPTDVLRELVQNEFDGGGDKLTVTFGERSLDVSGNGRGISADGWKRLSVIVGTGRVIGDTAARIVAKTNGIGSKNFGLRSLFLFGNQTYVRSNGLVAILDLPTLETGLRQDPGWASGTGVKLQIPYRSTAFEKLDPFTAEAEARVFESMAGGMLATLVKLALVGRKRGLRQLVLRSARCGRTLVWKQVAETVPCRMSGVSALRRKGWLTDQRDDGDSHIRKFEELEFTRAVSLPTEFSAALYPEYYRSTGNKVRIGVSLPISRRRIDLTRIGYFYYPLQTPDAVTGSIVSVSAPFDLNSDRSSLLDNRWNSWLIEQAAALTLDLLKEDWCRRFGADAFRALFVRGLGKPAEFANLISKRLSEDACWPTRAGSPSERHAKAGDLVIPESPHLDGFLNESHYLAPELQAVESICKLAIKSGARRFTVASLVRLRCAGKDRKEISTKIGEDEADYHFTSYVDALSGVDRQVKFAAALTALSRHLSKANYTDLRSSNSTLTATGELRSAQELVRIDPAVWEVCPELVENRLHPALVAHRAIARLSQKFDEQQWIVNAAERARNGRIDETERKVLQRKIITDSARFGRRALAAIRRSPVVKNQRGEWTAPAEMVLLKGADAKLMSSVVNAPSSELIGSPQALLKLRIRNRLNGQDIIAYAKSIAQKPEAAERFEAFLKSNQRLLTSKVLNELKKIPFLLARSGDLVSPSDLHAESSTNLQCLGARYVVKGSKQALYRRLGVRIFPTAQTMLEVLTLHRERTEPPPHMETFYSNLVSALARDRRVRADLAITPILWVGSKYYAPNEVLVGARIPSFFGEAVPVLTSPQTLCQTYVALGASARPQEQHWRRFFKHVSDAHKNAQTVGLDVRNKLLDAYFKRGREGWPIDLDESSRCLIDREGRLFSFSDVREGRLVESDFPALADVLEASKLGIVDLSDKSRPFFAALGIRALTSVTGIGSTVFGAQAQPPLWFKSHYRDRLLAMLRMSALSRGLHALAVLQRHAMTGFRPVDLSELHRRLASVVSIDFFEAISREYKVGDQRAKVEVETGVQEGVIGVVKPRTKLDFQQLFAQTLAEVAGAYNVAHARALSAAFVLLVQCRTTTDMRVYLERMGVDTRSWRDSDDDVEIGNGDPEDDVKEELLRQIVEGLGTGSRDAEEVISSPKRTVAEPGEAQPSTPPIASPLFTLPDLRDVVIFVAPPTAEPIQPRRSENGRSGGAPGSWTPRSSAETERDREVGERGEELVYRKELERVRAMGHENPEKLVIWTSRDNPGADHDIKSVGEDGGVRWIEVKSTTGIDGRFNWPRNEFEKALREGKRYELWRVYKAATTSPVAKCFVDPVALLGSSRLFLELGSIRARIENLD